MDRFFYLNQFKVRRASIEDCELLLEFIKDIARFEKLEHEVVATVDSLKASLFGQGSNIEAVFGEYQSEPIAFAVYFQNFSTFIGKPGLYLEDLYVKPEWRGNGIGRYLLGYLASIARNRDCERFEWCVLTWNERAITFYESLGATQMSEWRTYRLSGQALQDVAAEFEQTSITPP